MNLDRAVAAAVRKETSWLCTFKTSADDKAKLGEEALAKPGFIRAQPACKNEAAILRASVQRRGNEIEEDSVTVLQTLMAGWATARMGGEAFKASPTKAASCRASVDAESETHAARRGCSAWQAPAMLPLQGFDNRGLLPRPTRFAEPPTRLRLWHSMTS